MTRPDCFRNSEARNKYLTEVLHKLFPGEECPRTTNWGSFHDRCHSEGKASLGCDCFDCEEFRGRTDAETTAFIAEYDREANETYHVYKYGAPVPDDPALWEEWPPEEP